MVYFIKLDILSYYMQILQKITSHANCFYLHYNKLLSNILKLNLSILFIYQFKDKMQCLNVT